MINRSTTIQDRFEAFHLANPQVYDGLVRLARQALGKGHSKIGIELFFAVLRWESMMQTMSDDGFRLNNIYTSRYARLIMEREPDLDGFFETRMLCSA